MSIVHVNQSGHNYEIVREHCARTWRILDRNSHGYLRDHRRWNLLLFGSFSHDPGSGLAEVLPGFGLLRRLLWVGVCSLFQLIGLALYFIGFCTLVRHVDSFPQAGL